MLFKDSENPSTRHFSFALLLLIRAVQHPQGLRCTILLKKTDTTLRRFLENLLDLTLDDNGGGGGGASTTLIIGMENRLVNIPEEYSSSS